MALEQKLSLKLSQRLVMTPSLQQAIKLLQMTRLELETTVAQELEANPVLEEIEETAEEEEETLAAAGAEPEPTATPEPEITPEIEAGPKNTLEETGLDAWLQDDWGDEGWSGTAGEWEEREAPPLENTLSREPDLYDHLLWQIHMSDFTPRERSIAEAIVGNLDPDGFLVASSEEIRLAGGEGEDAWTTEEVEAVLERVRSLDPPGIACPTLRESLLRQLDMREEAADSPARRILDEYWDAFLRRAYPAIAKALGMQFAELEPVIETIRTLQTRPGRAFGRDRPVYVEPDVHVIKVGDEYVIQLNDDGLPRLRVSRAYRRMLQQMRAEGRQGEAAQYITEKMRSAVWLIKSLDQRQRTIYKVAESIVRQQREFLDRGVDHLRPMVLRDVAEDIGMHESTVSRVVSNKYVHTPRGLLPFKFFFHSGIDRDYGEDISSLSVKRKIKQLIDDEDPRHPLSDSELMRILNREGIQIARRTVAKYRDELNIPSSADRRKVF
ncbi:MAG: RNA polymerase factor sigma-54 [Thermoanaerobaculia bacterium]|nr:MAG: RNA polymerase factor sigma-54 [Thermoanaerobaculia bacterium]MBZ0101551.1 RNA polymerase factor sigma-54 [Thermoanaerobaculia bacterium]